MTRMSKEEFAEQFGDEIKEVADRIHPVPDFPKPGIIFRDIGPLLRERYSIGRVSYLLSKLLEHDQGVKSYENLMIAGVESRGFIFGSALAMKLGCGFVMVRKKGKLPGKVVGVSYGLEYGTDEIEVQEHKDPDGSVIVLDDVLATGGTAVAAVKLLRKAGAVVNGCLFLIELSKLKGRAKLQELGVQVSSLITY